MTDKLSKGESLPHLSRREAMTPANREELVGMLTRGFATSGVAFWTDATTGELLDALDAAGLAIVPKEPTDAMVAATCGQVVYHTPRNHYDIARAIAKYRAMLEASPYRGTDEKTAR
jgi:hypothetical protein